MKSLIGLILMGALTVSFADVPSTITYQGSLKESGAPVTGTKTMLFRLTNADGSQVYWSSGNRSVSVANGLFAVPLDPTGVDWAHVVPFIEVSVEGQFLSPREKLSASPYALVSQTVTDSAITASKTSLPAISPATGKIPALSAATLENLDGSQLTNVGSTGGIANGSITREKLDPQSIPVVSPTTGKLPALNANYVENLDGRALTSVGTASLADGAVSQVKLAAEVQDRFVPSGLIALFAGNCPAGWVRFTALDGRFPRGDASYGATGGSPTHSHAIAADGKHTHGISVDGAHYHGGQTGPSPNRGDGKVGEGDVEPDASHVHAISMDGSHGHGGTTGSAGSHDHAGATGIASALPPFLDVIFCQKQ